MKTTYPIFFAAALTAIPAALFAQSSSTPASLVGMPAPGSPVSANPNAPDPVVGDPVNTVFSTLGRPNGVITNPDKSNLLIFERGTVLIADGKVAETKLMPVATYNAKIAAEASLEADRQASMARTNALLQGLLSDPAYVAMSTRDRMAVLTKFDREHPGSEARKYLADLTSIYSAEQLVAAHVKELENQVNQARQQATMASQVASEAQQKLLAAQQAAVVAKAQADTLRQQSDLTKTQVPVVSSPLVLGLAPPPSNANTPGSKSGAGGVVLTPSNFGTTTPPSAGPAAPSAPATTDGHWVVAPDGIHAEYVPGAPGS